jgi:hypothetical protein
MQQFASRFARERPMLAVLARHLNVSETSLCVDVRPNCLRAWVFRALRLKFETTFFFGPEHSGKSIFYESLQRLVTKGVVKADRALTSEFNGELSGAIFCAVEFGAKKDGLASSKPT